MVIANDGRGERSGSPPVVEGHRIDAGGGAMVARFLSIGRAYPIDLDLGLIVAASDDVLGRGGNPKIPPSNRRAFVSRRLHGEVEKVRICPNVHEDRSFLIVEIGMPINDPKGLFW